MVSGAWAARLGLAMLGALATAPDRAAAQPPAPWSDAGWIAPRPVLEAVRPTPDGCAVIFEFAPGAAAVAALRPSTEPAPSGGRYPVEVRLPHAVTDSTRLVPAATDANAPARAPVSPSADAAATAIPEPASADRTGPSQTTSDPAPTKSACRPSPPPVITLGRDLDGARITVAFPDPRPLVLEPLAGGWRLGPPSIPVIPPPITSTDWVDSTGGDPIITGVHEALAKARHGDGPAALTDLLALLQRPPPAALRAALHLAIARLALREELLLVALGAASRAIRTSPDPRIRDRALTILLDVDHRVPTALSLVAADVAPALVETATVADAPALVAVAQALLRIDQPGLAASVARVAHRVPAQRGRARFVAHAAARLAGDDAAADAHIDALERGAPTTRLRAEILVARARAAYATATGAAAEAADAAWRNAAPMAEAAGAAALTEAITVERGWLRLRRGEAAAALRGLLPLDLDRHGKARALLVGTLYHLLCQPARAAAIAGQIIEGHALDPVGQRIGDERARLSHPRFAAAQAALLPRLDEHALRYEALRELSADELYLRQALRLRADADEAAGAELFDRLDPRLAETLPPPEPPAPTWRGARWSDPAPIADRCAAPRLPRPPLATARR